MLFGEMPYDEGGAAAVPSAVEADVDRRGGGDQA